MTLELFSNVLQTLVSSIVAVVAVFAALQKKTQAATLAAGFLTTFALGILYWFTYQFFAAQTPQVFYVADIVWVASFLFLLALQLLFSTPQAQKSRHPALYLPFLLGAVLTVYFCQWGDVFFNVCEMVILSICSYLALRNYLFGAPNQRAFHLYCIVFILTEYALWVASCFWVSDTWTNPYFWLDFAITIEIALFLPMLKKAVDV